MCAFRDIHLLEVFLSSTKANQSPGSPSRTADLILGQYLTFLKTTQGLADATLVLRRLHVKPFELSRLRGGRYA